jgi:DNA-binding response OmpR family regulator
MLDTPIAMLTSVSDDIVIENAFDLGADDYVLKTAIHSKVLARVRRLLARSGRGGSGPTRQISSSPPREKAG